MHCFLEDSSKMKKDCHHIITSLFLLVLLMSYKVGVTMFVHTHNVDGTMVAHSHPFTNGNHNHSTSQISVIALLSTFTCLEGVINGPLNAHFAEEKDIDARHLLTNIITANYATFLLRAPPFLNC